MHLILKCLSGGTSSIDVDHNTLVRSIKKKIEKDLKIPVWQQTLIFMGSPLQEDKKIGDYPKIKDGTKLYIVVKKPESLQGVLNKFLRRYYSEEQCKTIVSEFMKNFEATVNNLSLDDLERMAIANLNDQ